jgi:hypothetical protein
MLLPPRSSMMSIVSSCDGHASGRKCRCNDAVSYRVNSPRHVQAFGVFFDA